MPITNRPYWGQCEKCSNEFCKTQHHVLLAQYREGLRKCSNFTLENDNNQVKSMKKVKNCTTCYWGIVHEGIWKCLQNDGQHALRVDDPYWEKGKDECYEDEETVKKKYGN